MLYKHCLPGLCPAHMPPTPYVLPVKRRDRHRILLLAFPVSHSGTTFSHQSSIYCAVACKWPPGEFIRHSRAICASMADGSSDSSFDNFYSICGFLGGVVFTSSLIPQLIKTWRTKSARDLSYLWWDSSFIDATPCKNIWSGGSLRMPSSLTYRAPSTSWYNAGCRSPKGHGIIRNF